MLLGSEAAAYQYILLYAEELMPTEDTIKQISGNKTLLAGFDDPEVMMAVQDVAQNPANIQKYKNNMKVRASCKAVQALGQVSASVVHYVIDFAELHDEHIYMQDLVAGRLCLLCDDPCIAALSNRVVLT